MTMDYFENTWEKLEQADRYLERIHFGGEIHLNLKTLDELIDLHQCSIPYENIDIYDFHKPVFLDNAHLYRKIIENHRGGYCFELNTLFFSLLITLGFQAYPCSCRVMKNNAVLPPIRHRGTILTVDGRLWFCDVGYGGKMYPGAVLLEENHHQKKKGEEFWMEKYNDYWWLLKRTDKNCRDGFCEVMVGLSPNILSDYLPINDFTSGNPASPFLQHRRANIRTDTGYVNLLDDRLSIINSDGTPTIKMTLSAPGELEDSLEKYFGIRVCLN